MLSLLLCALITSFTPVLYTATSIIKITLPSPDITKINNEHNVKTPNIRITINSVSSNIKSNDIMLAVVESLNLENRKEFNPKIDKNRAIPLQIYDFLLQQGIGSDDKSTKDKILTKLKKNTFIKETDTFIFEISHTSTSRHLAQAITNLLAKNYSNQPTLNTQKEIISAAELPKDFSSPNLKISLYYSIILSFVIAIMATIHIYPRKKRRRL